ncbi:MAG TPA: hypothetical protein VGK74_07660 [Symbiobacteriaceae bacterium]|jgi:hypothetical protein
MLRKRIERAEIQGGPAESGSRGRWIAGLAAVLLLLGVVLYDPMISAGLFRDVTQDEALFRQAAAEVLKGHAIYQDDPRFRALFKLGYYQIDNHHGAVLFWRYKHVIGSGLLGVACIPTGAQPDFGGWMGFANAPPHFENKQLPAEFYIFSEE